MLRNHIKANLIHATDSCFKLIAFLRLGYKCEKYGSEQQLELSKDAFSHTYFLRMLIKILILKKNMMDRLA